MTKMVDWAKEYVKRWESYFTNEPETDVEMYLLELAKAIIADAEKEASDE